MNAPILWFLIPFSLGVLLLLFSEKRKLTAIIAFSACVFLAVIAVIIPINSMIIVGNTSIIFTNSFEVLGRTLTLNREAQPVLSFFYVFAACWILISFVLKVHRYFVPLVLLETALLIGMIATSPFIYGTFLIQFAVLIAIPVLWIQKSEKGGEGIIRFLLYQILGLIFLALGGWLASSVNINPSDTFLLRRTVIILLIGFIFWLAIFPFHNWVAILMDETCPCLSEFTITILQFSTFYILLNFLQNYLWLRTYEPFFTGMRIIGIIMLVIGSLWGYFQQSIQRMHAFFMVAENGILIYLLGVKTEQSLTIFFSLLFIRVSTSLIWALAVKSLGPGTDFSLGSLRGFFHRNPFISMALIIAYLSIAGLPLLPAFPYKTALVTIAYAESMNYGIAMTLGMLFLLAKGFSLTRILADSRESSGEWITETNGQKVLLTLGMLVLIFNSFYPNFFNQFIATIQSQFQIIISG